MSTPSGDTSSIASLEVRALEERTQLHRRATELKTQFLIVRQNLDPGRNARRHFGMAALILAALGLVSGYAVGGLFTQR